MNNDPYTILNQAAEIIQQRANTHGDLENNFQLIADMFSLRIGREFHPFEVCVFLECVKDARMFANPANADNYLDGINYRAFASMFASDYAAKRASGGSEYAYLRKEHLKEAKIDPFVSMDGKVAKKSINVDDLEKIQ